RARNCGPSQFRLSVPRKSRHSSWSTRDSWHRRVQKSKQFSALGRRTREAPHIVFANGELAQIAVHAFPVSNTGNVSTVYISRAIDTPHFLRSDRELCEVVGIGNQSPIHVGRRTVIDIGSAKTPNELSVPTRKDFVHRRTGAGHLVPAIAGI